MTERTRGYAHRVDIAAGVRAVWEAMTSASSLGLWCSPGARISTVPGGFFHANVDRVTDFDAHIDMFVPERRMRLIHLPSTALPPADVAIVDDFMLDGTAYGATLRLLGSGFPGDESWDGVYIRRRIGWERALARLKVLIEHEAQHGAVTERRQERR